MCILSLVSVIIIIQLYLTPCHIYIASLAWWVPIMSWMNDDAPTLIYCNLFYITLPPHNPVCRDGYMGSGLGVWRWLTWQRTPPIRAQLHAKEVITCKYHVCNISWRTRGRVTDMNCCPLRATSMVKGTPHMMAREMVQMMCMCPSREQSAKSTYWK